MTLYERYLRWRLKPYEFYLWQMLGDPSQWTADAHALIHKRLEVRFWISGGVHKFRFMGNLESRKLSRFSRRVLWRRAQHILDLVLLLQLQGMNHD